MQDYQTEKRQAWLRDLQSRQVEHVEVKIGTIAAEFLAAAMLLALPIVMLFAGIMLGF